MDHQLEICGAIFFSLAVLHTFSVKPIQRLANAFPEKSPSAFFLHLLGEVELVFGFWAGILILTIALRAGHGIASYYVHSLSFTEPAFVIVMMAMTATRPVIHAASSFLFGFSKVLPFHRNLAFYAVTLSLGPILGSFITEPAAMTVTALILKKHFFERGMSENFKYASLAVLLVNVSIGGVLTNFAAPPVLMVASPWQWSSQFLFSHFGWKAVMAVLINTALVIYFFRSELESLKPLHEKDRTALPGWLVALHLILVFLVVLTAHEAFFFLALFALFLGLTSASRKFQEPLRLRESLLVGFFLAGLVVLGGVQGWWLSPILRSLNPFPLFIGATGLTAFTDNAALTYLGTQVSAMTAELRYALVAGAVAGGGMTVIANAPNPAAFSLLGSSFGSRGIGATKLFLFALVPTLISMASFWLLPF